jgi:hypothetical protein
MDPTEKVAIEPRPGRGGLASRQASLPFAHDWSRPDGSPSAHLVVATPPGNQARGNRVAAEAGSWLSLIHGLGAQPNC